MSWEGYMQALCSRGHEVYVDTYEDDPFGVPCQCGSTVVWWNLVDTTNGSYDEDGTCIDGFIELELKDAHECVCKECGNKHSKALRQYKLPPVGGHWRDDYDQEE
jgi:hypothetical protein